jgi:tRNA dimethylallyltransferase
MGRLMAVTIVIVGPTASGKSGLAVALALAYAARGQRAEVVSADSMLVYRGMDVGTAKPTARERAGVVHHLVDVLDVTETASVAQFQSLARAAVADCLARGVVPILVGGSALYVRAVVDAFEFPGTDPQLRARLESELAELGPEVLHARLVGRDPEAAARILPANGRRVVRALEVGELTGRPFAAELPERRYALPDVVQIGLDVPRDVLDDRIRRRVDAMWAAGLVAEVHRLEQAGLRHGLTASRALGYRQVLQHLDGELDEAAARESTVVATRRFARRQDAWFRKDERIAWLAHDRPDLVEATLVLARGAPGGP